MNVDELDRSWRRDAACLGEDPNLFHPEYVDQLAEPLAVCARCTVVADCLGYALRHERYGVWGGTGQRERARLRRSLGIVLEVVEIDFAAIDAAAVDDEHQEAS